MFANTISITIASGQTRVLNRINQDNFGSEYSYSDANEAISMKIRHSTDTVDKDGLTMKRHNVYFERIVFPTVSTLLKKESYTATMRHSQYEDPTITSDLSKGVNTWLNSGTVLAELVTGQN